MVGVQKQKIQWAIFLFLVMLYFSCLTAEAQYGGGSGMAGDPYLIYTAEQMNEIGLHEEDWDKHFILMGDIDLGQYTGDAFNIIGHFVKSRHPDNGPFTGVFDGNGHTISNFSYSSADANGIGLFAYVRWPAEIKDLGLIDSDIDAGTGNHVGSLVGYNYGTVINCYTEGGSVSGYLKVGGLVGENRHNGTITNCYSRVSVTGDGDIGGLVGDNFGTITNSYATGSVSGNEDVGGLVGWCGYDAKISTSFWDIETSGQSTSAGGMGKTTAEMQTASTFIGWGCDLVWTIDGGRDYPRLAWQNVPGETITAGLYAGGSGTESDPYLISTAEHLNWIGLVPCDWDKHFKLMADIDLSGYTGTDFNIIGYWVDLWSPDNNPFTGVFDGNGKKISNFSYTYRAEGRIGLFGYVNGGQIKDLGLIEPNVEQLKADYVGSLVGYLYRGTITDCYVDGGSVTGAGHRVSGGVGGLVGAITWATITNCYSSASVSGNNNVGGLVGYNYGTITNCYATGSVSASIWGYGSDVGGLVGGNEGGTITYCYSTGIVSGKYYVGGLVGASYPPNLLDMPIIIDSYSLGMVTGNECVGGLVGGNHHGTIINCYAADRVAGMTEIGGLVGENAGYTTIESSLWDTETSGQSNMCGTDRDDWNSPCDDAYGKTTAEMQTASTLLEAGWDFVNESENGTEDIWWILEGQDYPRLWWEILAFSPDPPNGAVDVIQPLILSWAAGGSALQHDIYFGEDEEVIADSTTENPGIYRGRQAWEVTTYDPGTLELGKTYYWRVDEVNDLHPDSPWVGHIWSFTTAPGNSTQPDPANDGLGVALDTTLSWLPGPTAATHDVYFGTSSPPPFIGNQAESSFDPGPLKPGTTYYWQVDEIEADGTTIYTGDIWRFTTRVNFIVVDDFESYTDFEPDMIFCSWTNYWNETGAEIGYPDPAFAAGEDPQHHYVETTIVHGGFQSMPYFYDNNFNYSEATYSPTQRDWTEQGVGVLSLWFYGDPNNAPERMYVALNGGTAVYHDNPDAALIDEWTEWTIDLQEFTGVGLTNVNTLAIGFGDKNNLVAGGSGLVFFDDNRLYRPEDLEPVQSMKPTLKSLLRTGWQLAMMSD